MCRMMCRMCAARVQQQAQRAVPAAVDCCAAPTVPRRGPAARDQPSATADQHVRRRRWLT